MSKFAKVITAVAATAALIPTAAHASTMHYREPFVGAGTGPTLVAGPGTTSAMIARDERWISKSKIALGHDTITVYPHGASMPYEGGMGTCVAHPDGCSADSSSGVGLYAADRGAFYWESGHASDYSLLSDSQRAYFTQRVGLKGWAWWDSAASLNSGSEDGVESIWTIEVESCAWSGHGYDGSLQYNGPSVTPMPKAYVHGGNICGWISQVLAAS